jgi:hypothetical protein
MIRIAAGYLNLKFSSYWGSDDLQELAGTVAQCLLPARSEISRREGWSDSNFDVQSENSSL